MIEFRCLHEDELDAWHDHCMLVFNQGVVDLSRRQMFANAWYKDPGRGLEEVRVAVEDGAILSGLRVVRREIYLGGEAVRMGGIAFVSTKPEAQGRGLSTRLLQEAIGLMEIWGMEVSMLATDIFPFYGRLGWKQAVFLAKTLKVLSTQAPAPIRVCPLDFDRDLPAVMRMYTDTARHLNGALVRSEAYWNQLMRSKGGWWVAELEHSPGQAVACLRLNDDSEQARVIEFSALEPKGPLFDTMLLETLRQQNRAAETIHCPAVIHSEFETLEVHRQDYLMLRSIRPFRVGGAWIENTDQLLDLVEGFPSTFWETDGF